MLAERENGKVSRSLRFIFAHDFSMGFKSGEYAVKKRSLNPRFSESLELLFAMKACIIHNYRMPFGVVLTRCSLNQRLKNVELVLWL